MITVESPGYIEQMYIDSDYKKSLKDEIHMATLKYIKIYNSEMKYVMSSSEYFSKGLKEDIFGVINEVNNQYNIGEIESKEYYRKIFYLENILQMNLDKSAKDINLD